LWATATSGLVENREMQINDKEAQVKLIKKDEGEGCGPWTQFTVEEKSRNFARKKKVQKREPQDVAVTVAYVRPASMQRRGSYSCSSTKSSSYPRHYGGPLL